MTTLSFTPNLQRHVHSPKARIQGATVREVMEVYFRANPKVRSYVLDDQGSVRRHVVIFLNQEPIQDRSALSDPVEEGDEIFVMQALSGG